MNLLIALVIFAPQIVGFLFPLFAILNFIVPHIRNTFPYSVFLWLFAGAVGPSTIFGIRYARQQGVFKNEDRVVSVIQSSCYLTVFLTVLVLAASGLGAMTFDLRIFLNTYCGLIVPSTLAITAVMHLLEYRKASVQVGAMFLAAILTIVLRMVFFEQSLAVSLTTAATALVLIISLSLAILVILLRKLDNLNH